MSNDPTDFFLRVTAGPTYDPATHHLVAVNSRAATTITSASISASLRVRIAAYRGLPRNSPETSAYFQGAHQHDLYSVSFAFTPKRPINGADLVFGNDFDKPIRDRLPPGFSTALRFVRWAVDPGMDGDVQAEKPYLYGALLSSINVLSVGSKSAVGGTEPDKGGGGGPNAAADAKEGGEEVFKEGGTEEGLDVRESKGVPAGSPARMKYFLTEQHRKDWVFEEGREYKCDFFNPYLDFNQLALKLPGVTLHLMRFWDGQPLRYVLKEKKANGEEEELMVVVFTLVPKAEVEEEEASNTEVSDIEPSKKAAAAAEVSGSEAAQDGAKENKAAFVDEDID